MEHQLQMKPLSASHELRVLLKPFRYKVHLDNEVKGNPMAAFNTSKTTGFPFEVVKHNMFGPLYVRRSPRATQYEAAVHFCNYVTQYDQFLHYMLRQVQ